jgi:heme oxygenase
MEKKKADQEATFSEEVQRYIKQNRLQQRVKCSPALVSNGASLAKKREIAADRAKQQMNAFKSSYDQIKAQIEFNVANRPLLVEQVSKAFIHNLNQIKELQRYVAILREAGMNPDEHLTDEQRELLVSADYYDRLNAATAYFPDNNSQKYL